MILSFKTHFPDGKETFFAEKIWSCLVNNDLHDRCNLNRDIEYINKLEKAYHRFPQKKHTIRVDANNRWHDGMWIQASYNVRQKNQYQFAPSFKCNGTQKIEIKYFTNDNLYKHVNVLVDGKILTSYALQTLTLNDGFDNVFDFFKWFDKDFTGKIIHFTNFRY